ncbi:MAG: helix-turn-helix domain-containing protein, partial [Stackebrandtia sp.]
MSKARLIITAVILEGRCQAEVAGDYGVSKGWVSKLVARYRAEGAKAFQPRSRRPKTSPTATDPAEVYGDYRVIRGGGWCDEHWSCRASVRRRTMPTL